MASPLYVQSSEDAYTRSKKFVPQKPNQHYTVGNFDFRRRIQTSAFFWQTFGDVFKKWKTGVLKGIKKNYAMFSKNGKNGILKKSGFRSSSLPSSEAPSISIIKLATSAGIQNLNYLFCQICRRPSQIQNSWTYLRGLNNYKMPRFSETVQTKTPHF